MTPAMCCHSDAGNNQLHSKRGTVLWKELTSRGGLRGRLGILLFLAVFGILLPWQFRKGWVQSPAVLFYWAWVPFLVVTTTVADSL